MPGSFLKMYKVELSGYLEKWWKELNDDININRQEAYDLLGILTIAKGPLLAGELAGISPILHRGALLKKDLGGKFRRYLVGGPLEGYALCHPRFSDYLQTKFFPEELQKYREELLSYCSNWETHNSRYAFSYYPAHLFELGRTSDLIELALSGFVQQKIRHTHDVTGADRDFFLFFRACLRLDDLPNALKMARQRVGIASLNDWLASDALAPVLRHLAPNSAFATKMMGALEGIEPISKRAERLIAYMLPGLPEVFYDRILAEFERNWALINNNFQHKFLIAVARSAVGAIDYILGKTQQSSMSEELAQAIILRLGPLCSENRQLEDQALSKLGELVSTNVEAFVAATDAAIDERDRQRTLRILEALHPILPTLDSQPLGIMGYIALSQAFARSGEVEQAKTLVRYCLEHIPLPFEDTFLNTIYEREIGEAGARLIQATAPFPDLWERAVIEGRMLAARVQGRASTAFTLARLLRVTPAIIDPNQRITWLKTILAEIRDHAAQNTSEMEQGVRDLSLRLSEAFGGKPAAIALVEPLEQSIQYLYHEIDRVLVAPDDLTPLVDLSNTIVQLWNELDNPETLTLEFFRDVVPATAQSRNTSVSIVFFTVFTQVVAEQRFNFNEEIAILRRTFNTVATTQSTGRAVMLLNGMCKQVEKEWAHYQPKLSAALAMVLLDGVKESRKPKLLHSFDAFFRRCYNTASPTDRDLLWSRWATTHISLGEIATGLTMINKLLHDRAIGGESLSDEPLLQMLVADALVNAGENSQACQLLHDTVVEPVLANKDALEFDLKSAHVLLRAGDQQKARKFIIEAASRYRQAIGSLSQDVEEVLLNGVARLNDSVLVEELLASAEAELLEDAHPDSAFAVRWYALLALAISNERKAAQTLWQELSGWAIERRRSEVLAMLVLITHAVLHGKPWNDLLTQLRTKLDAIKNTEVYGEVLTHVERLLTFSMSGLRSAVVNVLLERADFLIKRKRFLWGILSSLTQRLVTLGDAALLVQTIDQIDYLLHHLKTKNVDAPDYLHALLHHLLILSQSLSNGELLSRTLNSVIQESSSVADARSEGDLVVKVLRQIDQRMTPHARDLLLRHALSHIPVIGDNDSRTKAWVTFGEVLVQQPPSSEAMHHALEMVETLATDPAPHNIRLVAQARIYRLCIQGTLHRTAADELERRIRTTSQPEQVRAQVAWAEALLPTPLNMKARQVVEELYANLDRFAARYDELNALEKFLEIGVELWQLDAPNRLLIVAHWAETMPLITNEDGRDIAFLKILNATVKLVSPRQADVQRQVLDCIWKVLPEPMRKRFFQHLVHIPLVAEVTMVTLLSYLEAVESHNTQTPAEKLEELICASMLHDSKNNVNFAASVLCKLLDRYNLPLQLKHRTDLARIACECLHSELKHRLGIVLRRSYESQGVTDLSGWDLLFLADMPAEWWIEHFTSISLAQVQLDTLTSWVERCMIEVPTRVSTAVMIATAWASSDIPDELNDLWFELATSESPIPLTVRSALTDMLIVQ